MRSRHPNYGPVPAHSRFRAGDRIQLHGYPGSPYALQRTGFRGTVLGAYGRDLAGITDTGQPWCEPPGSLAPDGEPNDSAVACTCCPRPEPAPQRQPGPHRYGPMPGALADLLTALGIDVPRGTVVARAETQQLDLLALIGAT